MGPLGVPEMLFILVLVLLIFGPKRLPEVGRMVGKGLGEFRRASNELKRSIQTELAIDELEEGPARRPALRPVPLPAEAVPTTEPLQAQPPEEAPLAARPDAPSPVVPE